MVVNKVNICGKEFKCEFIDENTVDDFLARKKGDIANIHFKNIRFYSNIQDLYFKNVLFEDCEFDGSDILNEPGILSVEFVNCYFEEKVHAFVDRMEVA